MVHAVPSGKQNSFAARNPPSLVMGVVRNDSAWSLANAYVKPMRTSNDQDLIGESVAALDAYWGRLVGMYGDTGIIARGVALDNGYEGRLDRLREARVASVPVLIDHVTDAASAFAS
jgi:CRISPR system Cascade subunit CasC